MFFVYPIKARIRPIFPALFQQNLNKFFNSKDVCFMSIIFRFYYEIMVVNKKLIIWKLILVNNIINSSSFYLSKSTIKREEAATRVQESVFFLS